MNYLDFEQNDSVDQSVSFLPYAWLLASTIARSHVSVRKDLSLNI